jgi:hypothetical protein
MGDPHFTDTPVPLCRLPFQYDREALVLINSALNLGAIREPYDDWRVSSLSREVKHVHQNDRGGSQSLGSSEK